MKQVIQLDHEGYFVGVVVADESPLEPGVFLIPAGCIEADQPQSVSGKRAKWDGGWIYEDIPQPEPEPEPPNPEPLSDEVLRKIAYRNESDPLFFKAQRGEATMDEWKTKVEEIKSRYPN
jgi:hypothetical protein